MSCSAALVCLTLTEADGSSLNKQWFNSELILYNIHSAATWRRWHNDKKIWSGQAWPPNTPGTREAKMAFSSRPSHRRTIPKDWENKCIVTTKQHRDVHKDMLHQPQKNKSLRDRGENTTYMVYKGEPSVKLYAKNVKVRTRSNGNPRQDQVTMERVDSPGSTNL